MQEQLFIPAIQDVQEINKEEEVGLSAEEMQLIAKLYTKWWNEWDGRGTKIDLHNFFWEQLKIWGHPKWDEREESLAALNIEISRLSKKYKIQRNAHRRRI